MPAPDSRNLNVQWCSELVRSLYEKGVRHVIISPGSRSTALTLTFAAHPGIQKHVIIDERSAAFTALGIAKATGMPACLVCTSGTALANYHPAVIEAAQSGVPLIVLSADRPPALRQTGASQTIDQIKIFGDTPVFFHEAGLPSGETPSLRRLTYLGEQAVSAAREQRGVAHINLPFAKPFEPTADFLHELELSFKKQVSDTVSPKYPSEAYTRLPIYLTDQISISRKPLVIAGPSELNSPAVSAALAMSKALSAPVLAEPASCFKNSETLITGFDGFLRSSKRMDMLKPDLILRFGQEPVSKALSMFLEHHRDVPQIRFHAGAESGDSIHSAQVQVDIIGQLDLNGLNDQSTDSDWLLSWYQETSSFKNYRDQILDDEPALTDGHVISDLCKFIPDTLPFFCSNSFPVRDLSLFGRYDVRNVYVNRGAAGIDGITSTAVGVVHGSDRECVLLTGDIAFLHDSNALLAHRELNKPLIVILFNNGGGTIFRMLPVHEYKDQYLRYFETPQQVDIQALCTAHGVSHRRIHNRTELRKSLEILPHSGGIHVIECMTDADASMKLRRLLWNN